MATLLLSAAGAAVGAGFGGTVLGLSGAVIGRAVGAAAGRAIDQRLLGVGSEAVDVGRIDRLRLTGASEGAPIGQVWGRMRLAGQVIWATNFSETVRRQRSGKGTPQPRVNAYSYAVSLAIGLCQGEILRVGRMWADGNEISPRDLNLRVYRGSEDQLPDPKIEAVEGTGLAPSYRGLAYVVIEDLDLAPYGNRVPQFSFEVMRAAQGDLVAETATLGRTLRGVALIPGTGEYGLATTPVHYSEGQGKSRSANVHSPSGVTDFATSLSQLSEELPEVGSVSLVVSWFGNDLRCSSCEVRPKVEQTALDGKGMPWRAGGIARAEAQEVSKVGGLSVYGGTPSDASVIEAITAIRASGKEILFNPFILMDQLEGNLLPDPWTGEIGQPKLPWRGRITLSLAPGRSGSPDRSAAAIDEVAAFFGSAQPDHLTTDGQRVAYSGPAEWSYRRFILHYARLCAVAGGVDAFCIGSELRSLTQIRDADDAFPVVEALRNLAADVRSILGADTKIGYAADWTEYFGYQADGNLYFHLDPLWSDVEIDFIGIDNYMPLSDWRDGEDHADAYWGSIYNPAYLQANIAGGEGFDWYYDSLEGSLAQRRLPIEDGAYDEPWVFRNKDLKSWWSNQHYDRIAGVRSVNPTAWVPSSKPIWFTEYGCPATDKGTNQPNRFVDEKSSESGLPVWSSGRRDDLIQLQYLLATNGFWSDPANNPVSSVYLGPMVDLSHAHAWAWDARPFPEFPGQIDVWSDGGNYARGHWLNGRATNQPLAAVVAEVCEAAGLTAIDASSLFGLVRGFQQADVSTGRSTLQSLFLAYGFDAVEREGQLHFRNRDARVNAEISESDLAVSADISGVFEAVRASEAEFAGQVRIGFVESQGSYELRAAEARFPDEEMRSVAQTDLPLAMTQGEARGVAERWLAEARIARDRARMSLPKSRVSIGAGDVIRKDGLRYRVDRVEQTDSQLLEAVRIEAGAYSPADLDGEPVSARVYTAPVPVFPVFLDLPLLTGEEIPHSPHLAVAASPWPGSVGVWSSSQDAGYEFNRAISVSAVIGLTETPMQKVGAGVWDKGGPLRVKLSEGELSSSDPLGVLNGANAMAIGDGSVGRWEVFQFCNADLVAPNTYDLSLRLRGQLGTDGLMPEVWPIGSTVVLLDLSLVQLDMPMSALGLARHYRIGLSSRGYDDINVTHLVEACDGAGLRPYPIGHLRLRVEENGNHNFFWLRRTRVGGDNWQTPDVPLGEEFESYMLRIIQGVDTKAEYVVSSPAFSYSSAMRISDGVSGPYRLEVAQLSSMFGPGTFRTIAIAV